MMIRSVAACSLGRFVVNSYVRDVGRIVAALDG
jgi:hypothetical protein